MSDNDPQYEVGYGRPPRNTQFRPGQSGNRKGRPKGAKGVRASMKRELARKVTIREEGREVQVSKAEALGMQLANKALKGDPKAIAEVLRLDAELFGPAETPALPATEPRGLQPDDLDILRHFAERARAGDWRPDADGSDEE
ncbi:MAG: DUF5681 domain-containing protein [Pseudomonadota bacterium]